MAVMTPVRTRTPGPVADLHVASDLQDHPRYPVKSNLDALKSAVGEHFAALPASAVQAAESLTVPPNRGIARDTVGAANPRALASRDHGVTLKHSDASVRASVERALATDIAKLVDPARSTVIYPGIK